MRRKLVAGAAVLLLVAVGIAGAYVLDKRRAAEDVRGSSTEEFVVTDEPEETLPPQPPPKPPKQAAKHAQPQPGIVWPTYGYDNERQRLAPFAHRPPYRRAWIFRARQLLEFPPAIAYGRLYFANNSGVVFAVNTKTGKRAWRFESRRCVAASPAVAGHTIYLSFLNRPPCNSKKPPGRLEGEVIAFATGFGKIRWRTRLGPTESSPLVANGRVHVGDWRGRVYALDERTGRVRWTFKGDGRIKSALTLSGNRLFVGTYKGHLYALHAKSGRQLWRSSSQDRLGGRGQFYSTPAAAYGRVFLGSTDGKMYAFGATTGRLLWSQGTGGYVYSSPAVWRRKVYAGSYSGRFFAFDAATGDVVWRFRAKGRISGSPTVMNGVVYFATLAGRSYALDARNGKLLWEFGDGQYSPLVADRDRVYLVGHARVYGMVRR